MPYSIDLQHQPNAVLSRLLAQNAQWATDVNIAEPSFFEESARGQAPKVLWIGCADSRVPESVVLATRPGDVFVHRNIANQVHADDMNVLSVIQYAVDAVGVEHVIIAGHTHCGGAAACKAAASKSLTSPAPDTPLGKWLEPLTSLAGSLASSGKEGAGREEEEDPLMKLVEENVKMQVRNVVGTKTMQGAWAKGKNVQVHGWVYHLENGRVRDLGESWGKEKAELLQLGL